MDIFWRHYCKPRLSNVGLLKSNPQCKLCYTSQEEIKMREIKSIFEKSTGYVFVVSYPKDAHDEFAIELMGHPTQLFSSKKELDEKLKSGVWAACKEPAHPMRHIHADHMIAAANAIKQFAEYIANEAIKFHILDCEKINESTVNPVHDFNSDK